MPVYYCRVIDYRDRAQGVRTQLIFLGAILRRLNTCLCALSVCSVCVLCLCALFVCSVCVFCLCALSVCSVCVFCLCALSVCSVCVFCLCVCLCSRGDLPKKKSCMYKYRYESTSPKDSPKVQPKSLLQATSTCVVQAKLRKARRPDQYTYVV